MNLESNRRSTAAAVLGADFFYCTQTSWLVPLFCRLAALLSWVPQLPTSMLHQGGPKLIKTAWSVSSVDSRGVVVVGPPKIA